MSPKKFLHGPKPKPLKLKQESHTVFKQQQTQIRKPIIIYTRSPKVIHTKPHDFMALVQKLTGQSGSKEQQKQKKTLEKRYDLNDDEFCNESGVTRSNSYVADIPLFTPNTSDYLFSPQRLLRLSDMLSSSPNKNTSLSPGSLVDFMNRRPEY